MKKSFFEYIKLTVLVPGIIIIISLLIISCSHSINMRKEIENDSVNRADLERPRAQITTHDSFSGYASYYGAEFHGKKTASGEIFDMHALTAAHKYLPFGTLCRVINLKNQKSVIVRINDRGPFIQGRIIDLSFQAAKNIGAVNSGVIPVKIEILYLPRN